MNFPNTIHTGRLPGIALLAALSIAGSACLAPLPTPPGPGPALSTSLPAPALAVRPDATAAEESAATASPAETSAAAGTPEASTQSAGGPGQGLDETVVKNAKYDLPDLGTVQLKDGLYEQQYGQGATEVDHVNYVQSAFGDLNGDGTNDAAVILASGGGGSGAFVQLIPLLDQNGNIRQIGDRVLGDRVQINSLAIEDGKIRVDMVTQGPNDPMCCPTQQVTETYQITGERLVLASQSGAVAAATEAPLTTEAVPSAMPAPTEQPQVGSAAAPAPQPPPATGPGIPVRIQFAPGATSATVEGSLPGRSADRWVVKAAAGQTMSVQLATGGGDAILVIFGADGTVLISDHAGATQWSGTLPLTEDYYIDVRSISDEPTNYTLTVTIPPLGGPQTVRRINFAPGATSATVQGEIFGRYTDRWVVKAAAGQTMTVRLTPTRGQAILIIFGADGNVLISDHAGATRWSGTLPTTQDYNIDVRGVTDDVNDYTLTVTIPPLSGQGPVTTRRINFAPGTTSATVYGQLPANALDRWILGARAGQKMQVSLSGNTVLAITDPNGNVLAPASAGLKYWQGTLPASGDYRVDVKDGGSPQDYALTVSIR